VFQNATPQIEHFTPVFDFVYVLTKLLHFLTAAPFFLNLVKNMNHFMNFKVTREQSAGSSTGNSLQGVGAVDIKASDSLSTLSFSSSLSAGSIIF
jgi:hypothetical protein